MDYRGSRLLGSPPYTSREHMEYAYKVRSTEGKYCSDSSVSACGKPCRDDPNCFVCMSISKADVNVEDQMKKRMKDNPINLLRPKDQKYMGIKNLGATCYMAALLQTLYSNKAFREGVYKWRCEDDICVELQKMFANLQKGIYKQFDPESFAKSCCLKTGLQQDAQEFFKVLITYLEDKLKNDPTQKDLIKNQFQGKYLRSTQCTECGNKTSQKEEFYELDLNIENKSTLTECITEHFKEEELVGYECDQCKKKDARAKLSISVLEFPPVLNIQLLRFVYDVSLSDKKKLTNKIEFGKTLNVSQYSITSSGDDDGNGNSNAELEYEISGVLCHIGSGASGGHYIAYIYDRVEGCWYKFNDSDVTKCESDPFGLFSSMSEHEYMLIYRQKQVLDKEKETLEPEPPLELVQVISELNSGITTSAEQYNDKKQDEELVVKELSSTISRILDCYKATYSYNHYNWIRYDWFVKWLASSNKAQIGPMNNQELCCEHKKLKINPYVMRRISSEAWQLLASLYDYGQAFSQDDLCPDCTVQVFEDLEQSSKRNKIIKDVEDSRKYLYGNKEFIVSEEWFNLWKDSSVHVSANTLAMLPHHNLLCPHGQLVPATKQLRMYVSKDAWNYFKSLYPNGEIAMDIPKSMDDCDHCKRDYELEQSRIKALLQHRGDEAKLVPGLKESFKRYAQYLPSYSIASGYYYIVSSAWRGFWRLYLKDVNAAKPGPVDNSNLLCRHKKLLHDPIEYVHASTTERKSMEYCLVDKKNWDNIVHIYGQANPESELACKVSSPYYNKPSVTCETELCSVCIAEAAAEKEEQLLNWSSGSVKIKEKSRYYGSDTEIVGLSSNMSVFELKLRVMERMDVNVSQFLLWKREGNKDKGEEVLICDEEKTLKEWKIKCGDTLELEKVEGGIGDFVTGGGGNEVGMVGFEDYGMMMNGNGSSSVKEEGFAGTKLAKNTNSSSKIEIKTENGSKGEDGNKGENGGSGENGRVESRKRKSDAMMMDTAIYDNGFVVVPLKDDREEQGKKKEEEKMEEEKKEEDNKMVEDAGWTCKICTYINTNEHSEMCEVCENRKT